MQVERRIKPVEPHCPEEAAEQFRVLHAAIRQTPMPAFLEFS